MIAQDGESKMLFTVLGVGVMELEWLYLVLGVYCFAIAILNWFCCPYIVREKYRNETWCKAFQRNIALPYVIYGIATIFLWFNEQNIFRTIYLFSNEEDIFRIIGLITIIVASCLRGTVKKKYGL